METDELPTESLSFMDQCTVICLGYVSSRGKLEIQSGKAVDTDELGALRDVAEQELTEFGQQSELKPYTDAASHLASTYEEVEEISERLQGCLQKLNDSLEQEAFCESANQFVEPPIQSWEKVSQLLQLVFKACEQHGTAKVGTVIDISVRYMRNALSDFVISQGGWKSLASSQPGEPEKSDISMSIVVVTQESMPEERDEQASGDAPGDAPETSEELEPASKYENESENLENAALPSPKNETLLPLSPLNTPPFSIPSSVNTDDERDSLATPPEMVERPLMTESYIQAMGEEFRRVSNTSGNDFELIGSDNGGTMDSQGGAPKSIDDVQAPESPGPEPEKRQDLQKTQRASEESTYDVKKTTHGQSTPKIEESTEEPALGGYLPHISIGVAAVAAVAGFFVLKKNL